MQFIFWYYTKGINSAIVFWGVFASFLWRYFAVFHHIRTLFSSWKRDVTTVKRRGLHPILWLGAFFENSVTRFLGAIVRLFVIMFGSIVVILAILAFPLVILLWILMPVLIALGLGLSFSIASGNMAASFAEGLSLFLGLFFLYVSAKSFKEEKENRPFDNLAEAAKQTWFSRVWNRIGMEPSDSRAGAINDQESFKNILRDSDLTAEEFQKIVSWEFGVFKENKRKKKAWSKENLDLIRPIGREWTFAYTVNLDKYAIDLSDSDPTEYRNSKLIGKIHELEMLELILSRPSQNSALIIGDIGTGRHTIIHTLAKRIRERQASPALTDKRLLEVNFNAIVTGATQQREIEDIIRMMFHEAAYAGNIILVFDNFDRHLKAHPQNPGEDLSSVLVEYLPYPSFQIIGITDPAKFHQDIEKKEHIMKYFDRVQVEEMNEEATMKVLLQNLKESEKKKVYFTYQSLREIIRLADRYVADSPFPEKALDLLDEILVYWSQNTNERFVTPQIVSEVVSKKIKVPLGEINASEKEKLINLEEVLHKRVIGQEFAIRQIAEAMRRARIGMASRKKPIGSFLFMGPTGVGKTESAKALSEAYFGDENRMIRLDMSEYQKADSIHRLLGSVEANAEGHIINKVKENPYSLLLLDEIEKAHPDILNLFLQILDEGWLTDAFGKKANFRNTIIIATSNAGSDIIRQYIEDNIDPKIIQEQLTDYVIKEGIFRPEFLNRFEGIVFFHPLSKEEMVEVVKLQLGRYASRLKNEENVIIQFDPQVVDFIIQNGYDRKFGARSVDRYIQNKVGDSVVKRIISGEVKKGDGLVFGIEDLLK